MSNLNDYLSTIFISEEEKAEEAKTNFGADSAAQPEPHKKKPKSTGKRLGALKQEISDLLDDCDCKGLEAVLKVCKKKADCGDGAGCDSEKKDDKDDKEDEKKEIKEAFQSAKDELSALKEDVASAKKDVGSKKDEPEVIKEDTETKTEPKAKPVEKPADKPAPTKEEQEKIIKEEAEAKQFARIQELAGL